MDLRNCLTPLTDLIPRTLSKSKSSKRNRTRCTSFLLPSKVRTSTGRMIVQREKWTRNAQLVLYNLAVEGVSSTKAVLTGRALFTKITTAIFNPSGSSTAVKFISNFERNVITYNDQQSDPNCELQGMLLKNLLQNAFAHVAILRDVAAHANKR